MAKINNKRTFESAYAAYSKGDLEAFLSFFTDDIAWTIVGMHDLNGKVALERYLREQIKKSKFDLTELVAERDIVIAIGKIIIQTQDSNILEYSVCFVLKLQEAKIYNLRAYVVPDGANRDLTSHVGKTVIGSGFTYDEAGHPTDKSVPAYQAEGEIINLPSLGKPNRP